MKRVLVLWALVLGCGGPGDEAVGSSALRVASVVTPFSVSEIGMTPDNLSDMPIPTAFDVAITPHDGMTETGETHPEVLVRDSRPELPADEQASFAGRIHLVRLDTGAAIDCVVRYVPPVAPERGQHAHRFVLEAARGLPAGWLAVEIDLDGLPLSIDESVYSSDGGTRYRARFRVDSHPRIVSVRVQERDEDALLELVVSERVSVGPTSLHLAVGGRDVLCEAIDPFDSSSARTLRLSFRCHTRWTDWAEVSVDERVMSASGEPLRGADDLSPAYFAWNPAEMRAADDSLRTRFLRLPVSAR